MTGKKLEIESLTKYYGKKENITKALNGISFQVVDSEFIGIMGSSGSGKTTLLNMMSTIDRVTAGHIYYGDVDITELSEDGLSDFRKDNLGFVFQDYNLLDTLTIEENIVLAMTLHKEGRDSIKKKCAQMLRLLGITDIKDNFPYQVSGGQKQRLCIARALLKRPRILILDDSTSAVDTATEAKIRECFRTTLKDTTKIIIAQRIGSVEESDLILVLDDGRIIGQGSHKDLLEHCEAYQEIYYSQRDREKTQEVSAS